MRKTPMGTCQQPCSVVRDPSGTPFVVSKNNTCKRSFGGITIKIHYKIKYLKVPTYDHGKRFLARLRQAAQHAERLGETALALALSQDADRHEVKVRRTPATFFYNRVEDIVIEAPSLTFEQIVDSLA